MRSRQDVFLATTRNRRYLADVLDGLSEDHWDRESLCDGWTVRHVAAHLLQHAFVGFPRFFAVSVRYRGSTDATVDHFARRLARLDTSTLVRTLREHAADQVDPPRVGPWGPFAETCIHLRDIARPLGLEADVPRTDWAHLLGRLTAPDAPPALVRPGRGAGLAFVATDTGSRHGHGALVSGTAEALCMALAGRRSALVDLSGPGVELLRGR